MSHKRCLVHEIRHALSFAAACSFWLLLFAVACSSRSCVLRGRLLLLLACSSRSLALHGRLSFAVACCDCLLALRGRLLFTVVCPSRSLAVAGCLLFAVACLGECEAIKYLFRNRDQLWVHIVDPVLGGAVELHGVLSPVRESKRTLLYLFQKTKHHQGKACTLSFEKCGTEILLKPTVCPPEPLRLLWL
jgi:hypothetical protein